MRGGGVASITGSRRCPVGAAPASFGSAARGEEQRRGRVSRFTRTGWRGREKGRVARAVQSLGFRCKASPRGVMLRWNCCPPAWDGLVQGRVEGGGEHWKAFAATCSRVACAVQVMEAMHGICRVSRCLSR